MNISVNGESASEVSELLRIMQLAGSDAKEVDIDDINQKMLPSPEDDGPCDVCGGDHGPSDLMAGCGGKSPSEEMADTIRVISKEDEDYDGGFGDATTAPDDEYMRSNAGDVSAMIPSGDDLHKGKGSHPATAGGDNPMNTTKESIHAMLTKALAEKQAGAKPDNDGDGVPPWADKDDNDPEVGADDEEVAEYDVPSNFENKHKDINNLGRKMMDMSSNMSGTDDTSLMMANALSRLGEVLAEFGGSGFAANNMGDVVKKSSLTPEIVKMLMKKAKEED